MEASVSVWGFSAEGSAQYAASRNSEGSDAAEALKSGRGEVVVSTARCFTHDVSVDRHVLEGEVHAELCQGTAGMSKGKRGYKN